jgi:putative Holliday junction resolvase
VKVLALDFGAARTGVAVSDPTGTLARPLGVVQRAADAGLDDLLTLIHAEAPDRIVVGLPLTMRGERGEQAHATEVFVEALRARIDIPVETFDERFTTDLAQRTPSETAEDARAAAHLLAGYLEWARARR